MRLYAIVLVALCLISTAAECQFEGLVETRNGTTDENGAVQYYPMTMWLKKGMARVDIPAFGGIPASIAIYRRDLGVIWMLEATDRSYFEMRIDDRKVGQQLPAEQEISFRKTGKTKKILTFTCEQFVSRSPGMETEIWATAALTHLVKSLSETLGGEGMGAGWNDEISRMGLFPMTSIIRTEGKVVESAEVLRVEPGSVSADRFEIPPEYKKQVIEQPR